MNEFPVAPQAAELSPTEEAERVERCEKLRREILACIRVGRAALWQMASALYRFNEEHGWSAIGYDELSHWLADPDIGMTKSTYHRLVGAWRSLVVEGGMSPEEVEVLDLSKVALVL